MNSPEPTAVAFLSVMPKNSQPLSDARRPIVACLIEIARWGKLYWPESVVRDIDTLERWAQSDADASTAKDAATRLLTTYRSGNLSCAAGHVASVVLADEIDHHHCKMLDSMLTAYAAHSPSAARDARPSMQHDIMAVIRKHFPQVQA